MTLAFIVVAWCVGGRLVASANQFVGPPPANLSIVSTVLESRSGSNIATWLMARENSSATLILLHSIRADRRSMLERAKLLHDAGYSIMMIDLQAHGESPGANVTIGYLEKFDVQAAVDYARTISPEQRIGLIGCSLGVFRSFSTR